MSAYGMRRAAPGKAHEECAVFGVSLKPVGSAEGAGIAYNALLAMQHRGQEGCGIAAAQGSAIPCAKGVGLVSEVFTPQAMARLPESRCAIGHTRYSTTGGSDPGNVQPFVHDFLTGRIATAHNGNVVNAQELRHRLQELGLDFSATSDTEVISALIAYLVMRSGELMGGVTEAAKLLSGAFCLVVMSSNHKIIAVRDPNGYRPLCIGENDRGLCVASESCALDSCGFRYVRDVEPGEVLLIEDGRLVRSQIALNARRRSLCVFEYVYFARPDSVIDGLSVYQARLNMGRQLAREHPVEADVVCGVPDSGLEAAQGYAQESGIPLATGFVKNRYIGRSFIFPTQAQRENAVALKLNPLRSAVEGKRVVLVDDSIVRGTTCARIVAAIRRAGAREVHLRISAPPFLHNCYFGTDIDDEENLIANRLSLEEIRSRTGADTLGYISVEGLRQACQGSRLELCDACFTGDYATAIGPGQHPSQEK